MGFLGIGTWEIILILILALIILGPGRLTEFARKLGKTVRAIRKATVELTTTVTRELDATSNEASPPQPPETSHTKSTKAPSTVSKTTTPAGDDEPNKPGEAPAAK